MPGTILDSAQNHLHKTDTGSAPQGPCDLVKKTDFEG